MSRNLRPRLSFANVVSVVALFVALGGSAYAIGLKKNSVKSKQIKDGQVKSVDVADDGLTGADVLESSLQLPAGAQGVAGPQGATGPQGVAGVGGADGADGAGGADGSPDTPAQVVAKLITVDGNGSALDTDRIDGIDSPDLLSRSEFASANGSVNPHFFGYSANTGSSNTFEFRAVEIRTTGTPGQFQVCANGFVAGAPMVRYVNGARVAIALQTTDACSDTFTPGIGGDFQIYGAGVMIWGVSTAPGAPATNVFRLFGIDAL